MAMLELSMCVRMAVFLFRVRFGGMCVVPVIVIMTVLVYYLGMYMVMVVLLKDGEVDARCHYRDCR